MKKLFLLLPIIIFVLATLSYESLSVAFAMDSNDSENIDSENINGENEISIKFCYLDSCLTEIKTPCGSEIKAGLTYQDFFDFANNIGYQLPKNGSVEWVDSDGNKVGFPIVATNDKTFFAKINDDSENVIITLIARYKGALDYQYTTLSIPVGGSINLPIFYEGIPILGYYEDPLLEEKISISYTATSSLSIYLLLDEEITFFINDKEYNLPYGCTFSSILDTDTHKVSNVYLDKDKTKRYRYLPYDSGIYYVDTVRYNYRVTIVNDDGFRTDMLVPITSSSLMLDDNFCYYGDSGFVKEISNEIILNDDVTIYRSSYGTAKTNLIQDILAIITFVIVVVVLIWRQVVKRKREKARIKQLKIVARSFYECNEMPDV